MEVQQQPFKRIPAFHYHEGTKALHIRLDRHDTISEVANFVHSGSTREAESLHLTLADGLFQPEHTDQSLLLLMCREVCTSLIDLKEIHIGRALSGFILTNAGAWCPVEAIQALLETCGRLECLMIRNLQVYSLQRRNASPPVCLLAQSLQGHASLQCFGWQHNEMIPRGSTTLDPIMEALSTIPTLKDVMIQSPPWAVLKVPTKPHVLKTLIGPNLQSLHLDGLQLQAEHITSLLGTHTNKKTSLQKISLSLQLTLDNIHDMGIALANFLQQDGSSLQHLGLRLEWLLAAEDNNNNNQTSQTFGKKRLEQLQDFQRNIANAIRRDNQLERLDLIYYDCSRRWSESAPTGPSQIFRELLQSNFTLTHLRLPFCAELDPVIAFLLKLNRTGLRQKLLEGNPTRTECLTALVEMQEACSAVDAEAFSRTGFSMLYALLREMPTIVA